MQGMDFHALLFSKGKSAMLFPLPSLSLNMTGPHRMYSSGSEYPEMVDLQFVFLSGATGWIDEVLRARL